VSYASDFNGELNAFGVEVVAKGIELKTRVMLETLRGLVFGTPVGQPRLWKRKAPKGYVGGYHRGQWQMSSGEPAEGQVPLRSPAAVFSEAEGVEVDLDSTGWITSNGPGITALEFKGHSSQARDGWARAVVERIRSMYDLRS
jgi:hypothetical protein